MIVLLVMHIVLQVLDAQMLTLPPLLAPGCPPSQGWCTLASIDRFKFLMEKLGLYRRVQGPQALLRQHERRIQVGGEEGRWAVGEGRAIDACCCSWVDGAG